MPSASCPQQPIPPIGPSCFMSRAVFSFLPTIAGLILIPMIAFASPPYPLWIASIYDGPDNDDIASLVYEIAVANVAPMSQAPLFPHLLEMPLESLVCYLLSACSIRCPRSPSVFCAPTFTLASQLLMNHTLSYSVLKRPVPIRRSQRPICFVGAILPFHLGYPPSSKNHQHAVHSGILAGGDRSSSLAERASYRGTCGGAHHTPKGPSLTDMTLSPAADSLRRPAHLIPQACPESARPACQVPPCDHRGPDQITDVGAMVGFGDSFSLPSHVGTCSLWSPPLAGMS